MSLNVAKGTITAPGSTGVQTYNLASNFDPKIVILWMTFQTADGTAAANGHFTMGFGTKDGGSIQQQHMHLFALGGQSAAEQTVHGQGNSAILKGANANSTTIDFEVDLNDIVTGSSSSFKLDWVNLPGTASLLVHYLVLGGDSTVISAARAGSFATTAGASTNDVTVAASWGQPDGVMFLAVPWTDNDDTAMATADAALSFGVALSDSVRRTSHIHYEDGSATMALASWQKEKALVTTGAGVTADAEMDLSAKASWPTDGFQVSWSDTPGFAYAQIGYLAWKGTMTAALGNSSVPTSTGNQTLTGTGGSTARGALMWSTMVAASGSIVTAATGLGGFAVGATDGTNEGAAATSELDGDAASQTGNTFTQTKAMRMIISVTGGAAPTVKAEADSSLSGADVVLNWTTVDASVSRDYNWVVFGEPGAAATSLVWQPAPSSLFNR